MRLLNSIDEARGQLRLGRSTVCNLIATGELESVKIGRARRIPQDALESYVARLRAAQADPDSTDGARPGLDPPTP